MRPQPTTLSDLTLWEQRLVRAYRWVTSIWPSHEHTWALLAAFLINTFAMAADSNMRGGFLWLASAAQATLWTGVCITPGLMAIAVGAASRVNHRWTLIGAVFVVAASIA